MNINKIEPQTFKRLISDAGVAFMGIPAKESLNYMPYGELIRNLLYTKAMNLLNSEGYQKVVLSDFIDPNSLIEIDKISKISSGYMKIENKNLMIAAGHEVNAYIYTRELLKHYNVDLPIRIYNFGSVYRSNKNTRFPFNLGERKSFLECYAVFKSEVEAEQELDFAINWNRKIIKEMLHIPSVEVLRPVSTNKKISKRTICIDSITPIDETVITGMTYFHNDIFTKALNVKYKEQAENRNKLTYSIHFGLSENILFSYLLNSCNENGLRLHSFIAPIQVSILNSLEDKNNNIINNIIKCLKENSISYNIEKIMRKKINSKIMNNSKKGIPVTIILKNKNDKIEIYSYHNNIQELIISTNNEVNINNIIDKIKKDFQENDKQITEDMILKEKESIVYCNDLEDLDEIVKSGRVAKIHLQNTDIGVHQVESYLTGGEVLGFGIKKEQGRDIITKEKSDTIAFVSRRS